MRNESERSVLGQRTSGRRRYAVLTDGGSSASDRVTLTALTAPAGRPCYYAADTVLTEQEVAAVLDVSVKTLRRLVHDGALAQTRVLSLPRFLYGDVVACLRARRMG